MRACPILKDLLLGLVAMMPLPGLGQSQGEIALVSRPPIAALLQGKVDFDAMNAVPYPGARYKSRLPFPGLVIDTYFRGQLPILRKTGRQTYGELVHDAGSPLKEGGVSADRRMSTLMVAEDKSHPSGNFLLSRVHEYAPRRRELGYGFGTIALKFSNDQQVLGFDLLRLPGRAAAKGLRVRVRFLDVSGRVIGAPMELTSTGTYTFQDQGGQRRIRGVEIVNLGLVPIGLDTIVFQLPLVIG